MRLCYSGAHMAFFDIRRGSIGRRLSFPLLACCLALPLGGCGGGMKPTLVQIDPRAADSFLSLCRDYPLPAGIEYRYLGADRSSASGDLRLVFGERPQGKAEKAVSGYMPYPIKLCWEQSPEKALTRPLADIQLPECVWTENRAAAPWLKGELILGIGKKAPHALKKWFSRIPSREDPRIRWIAAVGDLMLGRGIDDILLSGKDGIEKVFGDTLEELRTADFLLGNLEGPLTARGKKADKSYSFRFKPSTAVALKDAGFDYVSLCNNHSFDFGLEGFTDTLAALRDVGLPYSGAGMDYREAFAPLRAKLGDQSLCLVAFGAFTPEMPPESILASDSRPGILMREGGLAAIGASSGKETVDIAVVHSGSEYADTPNASLRSLYHDCVYRGADIVLGSHPHVLQGIEVYKGRLIAYSLGNFVFRGMEGQSGATDTMILRIGLFDGRVVAVDPVFVTISDDGPRLAPESMGERFYSLSRALAKDSGPLRAD
jgi:poly-gamma-glutamate capsule biosynthesis protein CapA/YwtB (metallophosphatase superfamily)